MAPTVMRTGTFCDLRTGSWRIGKAGSVIHPESKGLGTRNACVWRQEKVAVQAEGAISPFLSLLVLLRPSIDWLTPTHIGSVVFSSQSTDSTLLSLRNILTDTPRNAYPVIWASLCPVKKTDTINHHIIQGPTTGHHNSDFQAGGVTWEKTQRLRSTSISRWQEVLK